MKRVYHHFEKWEDWRDGLYRQTVERADEIMVERAARLLRSPFALRPAMLHVAENWTCAAEQNMTNASRNRQAWLGQAACCYVVGAPEDLTKQAWHRLTTAEQDAANAIADEVIRKWEDDRTCRNVA